MRTHRTLRVQSLIKRELGAIITKELDIPAGILVTISDVVISSKKLEEAKILISIIPSAKVEFVMKILEKRQGYFQHCLNNKMNIKPMPRIVFVHDQGLEHAAQIEKILMEEKI